LHQVLCKRLARLDEKPNVLYSYYPAQWHRNLWREGFVAGNGRTGINVLGAVQHETVLLNRGDLWTGLKKTSLPDVSDALKQMNFYAIARDNKNTERSVS